MTLSSNHFETPSSINLLYELVLDEVSKQLDEIVILNLDAQLHRPVERYVLIEISKNVSEQQVVSHLGLDQLIQSLIIAPTYLKSRKLIKSILLALSPTAMCLMMFGFPIIQDLYNKFSLIKTWNIITSILRAI